MKTSPNIQDIVVPLWGTHNFLFDREVLRGITSRLPVNKMTCDEIYRKNTGTLIEHDKAHSSIRRKPISEITPKYINYMSRINGVIYAQSQSINECENRSYDFSMSSLATIIINRDILLPVLLPIECATLLLVNVINQYNVRNLSNSMCVRPPRYESTVAIVDARSNSKAARRDISVRLCW